MSLAWAVEQYEREARGEMVSPDFIAARVERRNNGAWIQTRSGRAYPLLAPRPEDVCVEDIAYALAGIARYTGHARRGLDGHGYTVAQHSVLVSEIVPPEDALAGLMHDAAEAYVGDMSAPLKRCLPEYAHVERLSYLAIARRFGLPLEIPASVKHADLVMLATEKRDLMVGEPKPWLPLPEPIEREVIHWTPATAESAFLGRFHALMAVRHVATRRDRT